MKKNKGSPYQQELIGNHVSVVESTHMGYTHISGMIMDETKNTLMVCSEESPKMIPKKGNVFNIKFKSGSKTLVGDRLMFRPEDRIKRLG